MPKATQPTVNVFIADESKLACQLMEVSLRRSRYKLAVLGHATESSEIRAGLGAEGADVVVVSARLRDGAAAGFDITRELQAAHPSSRVVMILDSTDRASVIEAFRSGASGIFSRDEPFEHLCKCIYSVHQGQVWANSKQLRFVIDTLVRTPSAETARAKPNLLTQRERGVVDLVAEGFTNRDISRQLNLSEHTVRNYLFRIFNKVGTSNRLELALYALNRREGNSSRDLAG